MSNKLREKLLDAALPHVAFEGWGDTSLIAAATDVKISAAAARAQFLRGGVDMAIAFHQRGDDLMVARMAAQEPGGMRYSERVAAAVRFRLQAVDDRDLVRRAMTLFALPQYAPDGARLVWGTADRIWTALGDTSDDINWYSKRAILSGVYASCVLFWLGDNSADNVDTWEFVDRRIADVMRFEKFKSRMRASKALAPLRGIPDALLGGIRAPTRARRTDLPGRWDTP